MVVDNGCECLTTCPINGISCRNQVASTASGVTWSEGDVAPPGAGIGPLPTGTTVVHAVHQPVPTAVPASQPAPAAFAQAVPVASTAPIAIAVAPGPAPPAYPAPAAAAIGPAPTAKLTAKACEYLPFQIRDVPVLLRKGDGYLVDNSLLKSQLAGLTCRSSKNTDDKGERIIDFGSTVDGVVEQAEDGVKWLKVTAEVPSAAAALLGSTAPSAVSALLGIAAPTTAAPPPGLAPVSSVLFVPPPGGGVLAAAAATAPPTNLPGAARIAS